MASGQYCKYCHHFWKSIKEYEKHASCCEYFYHQRRNQPTEMEERGTKLPTMREMFRCVQDLTHRLEKTEKELTKVRALLNTRQKRVIIDWLNQPPQTPQITFEKWWREMKATESDMLKVIGGDLSEGILSCLDAHIQKLRDDSAPIRCFSQKPNTFYIYSAENGRIGDELVAAEKPGWRIMSDCQLEKMATHIKISISREFTTWRESNLDISAVEYDMDKMTNFMTKINGNGVEMKKRLPEMKKRLSKLEENLRVVMDCEFE